MYSNYLLNSITYLIYAIPISLVLGAAISEICLSLSSLLFLIYQFKYKNLSFFKSKIFAICIVFCIYLIIRSAFSEFPLNSLRSTLFYFRFFIFVLAIMYLLENQKNFSKYFFISIGITFCICFIFGSIDVYQSFIDPLLDYRISGIFGTELVQGSFFVRLIFIFSALFFFVAKFKFKNYFFYSIFLISLIFILLSGERSAIGLMLIGLVLYVIFCDLKFNQKFFLLLISMSLLIIALFTIPGLKNRVITNTKNLIFENERVMAFSRGHQEHYTSALIMFNENKIFGVGVRNFRLECRKERYKEIGINACTTHPHNTYIQFLAETGIIGFIFIFSFLAFISKFIIYNLINLFMQKKVNTLAILFSIPIFINIFPLVPTGNFFNNWLSTLYFLPLPFFFYTFKNNK